MKSGRCCKHKHKLKVRVNGLNPFEVREVLQDIEQFKDNVVIRLNPFEVREVLQGFWMKYTDKQGSLNPFEVREVLQEI